MKKRTAVALFLLAVLFGRLNFVSQRGQPSTSVTVEDLALEDNRFSMTVSQGGNSGMAFRESFWEIEDSTLYVTLFSGLARNGFYRDTMDVEIEDNRLSEVRQVCLQDASFARLIYSR